ncbi:MAG: ABC transporter ATP-binding protein [Microbacterium sp.]|uniref:ABC transporter ATP-binding protein n=1 Tax=Microbacterium sp. TaxID=51671 RepID=UPI003F80D830
MSMTTDNTNQTGPDVVIIEDVSKRFVMRRDNSLKERIVTLGRRGRAHQEVFDSLKHVSVRIPAGTSIGLMGPNGSGKSTLLKIIGGIIDPSEGRVLRRGRLAALLELGAGFHPDLSGRDNVYLNASILGLSKEETDAQFDSIVAFSEIGDFIDTQVKFYSSGMYVRLAFAVAVHTDPDILLVDEVLAVGDEAFQRKCMDKIRQFQREGRTIILVSHSASQVMDVCDQGVVLRNGEVAFVGSAADATKIHREILEGKRKRSAEGESSDVERKISAIRAVRVLNAAGELTKDVRPGDDIIVQIDVDHSNPHDEWYTTFSIDTPTGQQVFGTGARRLGGSHQPVGAGVTTVEYLIPRITFGGGQYFVNADVLDADQRRLDVLWQATHFFVPVDDRLSGTVYAEARLVDPSDR